MPGVPCQCVVDIEYKRFVVVERRKYIVGDGWVTLAALVHGGGWCRGGDGEGGRVGRRGESKKKKLNNNNMERTGSVCVCVCVQWSCLGGCSG